MAGLAGEARVRLHVGEHRPRRRAPDPRSEVPEPGLRRIVEDLQAGVGAAERPAAVVVGAGLPARLDERGHRAALRDDVVAGVRPLGPGERRHRGDDQGEDDRPRARVTLGRRVAVWSGRALLSALKAERARWGRRPVGAGSSRWLGGSAGSGGEAGAGGGGAVAAGGGGAAAGGGAGGRAPVPARGAVRRRGGGALRGDHRPGTAIGCRGRAAPAGSGADAAAGRARAGRRCGLGRCERRSSRGRQIGVAARRRRVEADVGGQRGGVRGLEQGGDDDEQQRAGAQSSGEPADVPPADSSPVHRRLQAHGDAGCPPL